MILPTCAVCRRPVNSMTRLPGDPLYVEWEVRCHGAVEFTAIPISDYMEEGYVIQPGVAFEGRSLRAQA